MTTIRLHCRSCGMTQLTPANVVVVNLASGRSELLFRCCRLNQAIELAERAVFELLAVGVEHVEGGALPVKVRNAIHIEDVPALVEFRSELAGVSTPGDIQW